MMENAKLLLERTEGFVRERLEGLACGHDFWHIHRVRLLALRIAKSEGADAFLVEMAALLHDIADPKLNASAEEGRRILEEYLEACGLPAPLREKLEYILARVSFTRELGAPDEEPRPLELQAVQDADKLDALGAIGIARTFAYGGSKGQAMHEPGLPPREALTPEAYRQGRSTSINHFHEKLLKLKSMMNTKTGKALAEARHRFMVLYLEHFQAEWEGRH
jgi:uncharacterized protein